MKAYAAHAVLVDLPARLGLGEDVPLAAIEDEFFPRIKLGNRTYKTTARNRLDDVDAAFLRCIAGANPQPTMFLDVAASSGVTSVDWLNSLTEAGLEPRMTMTDLTAFAYLVSAGSWFRALLDANCVPLEYEIFSKPIPARPKKIDLLTGKVLLVLMSKFLYRRFASGRIDPLRPEDCGAVKLPLVSHEVRQRSEITVLEDDITADDCGRMARMFDVIRAANILQMVYLDEAVIRRALSTLKNRLKGDGSWLIVCRTLTKGDNHASIFRLQDDRFAVQCRVGRGSEIEHLVLAA